MRSRFVAAEIAVITSCALRILKARIRAGVGYYSTIPKPSGKSRPTFTLRGPDPKITRRLEPTRETAADESFRCALHRPPGPPAWITSSARWARAGTAASRAENIESSAIPCLKRRLDPSMMIAIFQPAIAV